MTGFSTVTVDNTTGHGHIFDSVKVGHDGTVYGLWSDDHNIFYAYSVQACDNGSSGATDTFAISIDSNYSASGTLSTGNINVHEK